LNKPSRYIKSKLKTNPSFSLEDINIFPFICAITYTEEFFMQVMAGFKIINSVSIKIKPIIRGFELIDISVPILGDCATFFKKIKN